jgi:hypothetical protein
MKKNVLLFVTLLSVGIANGQVHYAKNHEHNSLRRNTNVIVSSHQENVTPELYGDFEKTIKAGDSCILSFEIDDNSYQLTASNLNPEINGNAYDALPSASNALKYILFSQKETIDSEFSAIIEAKDGNGNSFARRVVVTIEAIGENDFMMDHQDHLPILYTDSIHYIKNATINFLPDTRYRSYMDGVNFYINNELVYTDHSLPYELPKEFINNLGDGCHKLTAKPYYLLHGEEKKIATRNIILVKSFNRLEETKQAFRAYPNPVVDKVSIVTFGKEVEKVQLKNLHGERIAVDYKIDAEKIVIDTESLQIPPGIYLVEVLSNGRWQNTKIIKQ